ncbi:seminal fluid protein HACP016 [Danaus plexippus plexippus]|uniref:Seminal fluid protein HACP016 n=2 Tax=Danaus plexippus TaxID=13037 RepID=A0A212EHM3_DANPL|nr:seminal fluid protein HACP016 [Danaus plexippus plexippus]
MVWTAYILVTCFLIANAYRLPVEVYEIRKTRDRDPRVDIQYYDPDLERVGIPIKQNKRNIDELANYIIESLKRVPQNYEDNRSVEEDGVFVDETRSLPVVIVPNDRIVYRKKPREDYRVLHKLLHSALRTNDAEDRTAAPRHRGTYDKDDY